MPFLHAVTMLANPGADVVRIMLTDPCSGYDRVTDANARMLTTKRH